MKTENGLLIHGTVSLICGASILFTGLCVRSIQSKDDIYSKIPIIIGIHSIYVSMVAFITCLLNRFKTILTPKYSKLIPNNVIFTYWLLHALIACVLGIGLWLGFPEIFNDKISTGQKILICVVLNRLYSNFMTFITYKSHTHTVRHYIKVEKN